MSAALQYFEENLPHRPYHTDELAFGLRISGKGRALLARYIQQNQPHAQFWLVLALLQIVGGDKLIIPFC